MLNNSDIFLHSSHKVYLILIIIALSFASQISLRYDFGLSNKHFYDIIYVAPDGLIIVTIWYIMLIITVLLTLEPRRKCTDNISIPVLLALLSTIPYLMEVIANIPSIWARDVYLHGRIRFLDSSGKLEELAYEYPKQYPGFFILLYILYAILGHLDIRYVNLIILYPIMMLVLPLILFILYRTFLKNSYMSAVLGIMITISLLMNNRSELTFQHANTRFFSLILLVLSMLLLSLVLKRWSLSSVALFVLSTLTLNISHVLFPQVVIIALLILSIISIVFPVLCNIPKHALLALTCITASVFILWTFYNYYTFSVIKPAMISFFDYYYRILGMELIVSSLTIRESIPWFGTVLRNIFKFSLAFLAILAGILIIKHVFWRKKVKLRVDTPLVMVWFSYIVAIIFVFGLTIFSISLGNSINRGLIALIPLVVPCAIAQLLEFYYLRKVNRHLARAVVFASITILCLNQFMLLHEEPIIVSNTQPLDYACQFLTRYNTAHTIVTFSPFMIYYGYFAPKPPSHIYTGDLGSIEAIHMIGEFYIRNQGVKVLDFRTIVYWSLRYEFYITGLSEWIEYVLAPLRASDSLVYSNGNYTWIFYGFS